MLFAKEFAEGNEQHWSFREALGEAFEWVECYSAIKAAHAIGRYLGIRELELVE